MNTYTPLIPGKIAQALLFLAASTFLMPVRLFGQAPDLGTADSYGLFTSVGAISNTGPTVITGDIGSGAGAFTGFPPGTVTGNIHVADPAAVQASTDVEAAYLSMNSIVCNVTLGPLLGSGQTLTPAVYCVTTAATLTGTLTLDAQGDPSALFIFKINGAFATGTFANVLLVNSAQRCNVYWQINGKFDLGDQSFFQGNILANGAINLLDGATLGGRGLSRAGAVTLTNTTVNMTCPVLAFPIELVDFTASCWGHHAAFTWKTASETNNAYFTLEGSRDGASWEIMGKIVGAGNSGVPQAYAFTGKPADNDVRYYRLKQTDFNQKSAYSFVVFLEDCQESVARASVYPNPANGTMRVLFTGKQDQFISVTICNAAGITVYASTQYQPEIMLLAPQGGIYFVRFLLATGTTVSRVVVLPD